MNVGDLSDEQVLLEGGDGHSHPLKAHKARAFAEEIVRLRKEHRSWLDAEAQLEAERAKVERLTALCERALAVAYDAFPTDFGPSKFGSQAEAYREVVAVSVALFEVGDE